MSIPRTEQRSTARRMLDRFTGGQPSPPGRPGKAWSISIFFLAPVFVYLAFEADQPVLWNLFILCFVLGGMASAISRPWYRRTRLAYGMQTAGVLVVHVGMIAFIANLGVRGEWGLFGYAIIVYGVIALMAAAGVFRSDPVTRDERRDERS